jgi:ABC-type multidrug transport system fused ATPase/permease subunit
MSWQWGNHVGLMMQRQWRTVQKSLSDTILNIFIIWPLIFTFGQGYCTAHIFFPENQAAFSAVLMTGAVLIQAFVVGWFLVMAFLEDRETSRIFSYHAIATSYSAAFWGRFFFYHLWSFFLLLPILPIAKVLLGVGMRSPSASWAALYAALFLLAGVVSAYLLFLTSLMKGMRSIEHMWALGIEPFILLGGSWVPAHALLQSGIPGVSYFLWFNPFIYATELLRQLFFHSQEYASVACCVSALLAATALFLAAAYVLTKRRLDLV